MIRIVYISCVDRDFGQVQLGQVLSVARIRNKLDGITGMLVYHDQAVLQVLEGPEDKVDACYERIKRDPRHRDVASMDKRKINSRAFSDWSMGITNPDAFRKMPGVNLHSFSEIAARMKEVSDLDVPYETLHVVQAMRRFVSRAKTSASS